MNTLWLAPFLAHGGWKLIILAIIIIRAIAKKNAENSRRERGPEPQAGGPVMPVPQRIPSFKRTIETPQGSPWTGGDAFDDIKK